MKFIINYDHNYNNYYMERVRNLLKHYHRRRWDCFVAHRVMRGLQKLDDNRVDVT